MKEISLNDFEHSVGYIVEQRGLFKNVTGIYSVSKRLFDMLAAVIGICLLSPILLIVALIIKFDSKGPVIFKQKRLGFKGQEFNMYKFRSMVPNAEQRFKEVEDLNEVSGFMFKIKQDPRVTKVGRIIRKTSLDELPQLFNVFKGDMSLVGPRPPIGREVQKYHLWHNLRLSVRPGITGLWQVSGRNDLGFEDMCRLDLKYIRERGFLYDLKIILKTIPVVLGDSRAS